jgi:hypothetical protein
MRFFGMAALALALSGCGNNDAPPKPPADIPAATETPAAPAPAEQAPPVAGPKCTDPPKACPGGAAPTTDPATCKQTCPGE